MKIKVIGILVLLVFLAVLTGCEFFNTKVTKENYDKIKAGMTKEQVTEILGKASITEPMYFGEFGTELRVYQSVNKGISVTFAYGKVIDKNWIEE